MLILGLVVSVACSEGADENPASVEATTPGTTDAAGNDASGSPSAPMATPGAGGNASGPSGNASSGTTPDGVDSPGAGGDDSSLPRPAQGSNGGQAGSGNANGGDGNATGGTSSAPTSMSNGESGGSAVGGAAMDGSAVGGAAMGDASVPGSATGVGGSTGASGSTSNAGNGGTSAAGGAPSSPAGTPVARHGQLRVSGNRLHDQSDQPVTLRGQGFGWDNWWPQYYNADVVNWLGDDWCVDIVRPAMGIEPDGAYLENPSASEARIRAVVDAAIDRGLYVIIDWHAHDEHRTEALAFFRAMAESYAGVPNVLYEVWNEPEADSTWAEVKAYAEAVIAAIREHDRENVVIVGSPEWNQRIDLAAADPITSDQNVIYSVHFYAATHGQWLRDRTAEALAQGVPVLVSESSGSEAAGTGANDYGEWEAWFTFMDENQLSWINYSVSDKEGETISVLEPGAPSSGGWDESQLTETGEYIRGVFRGYCD